MFIQLPEMKATSDYETLYSQWMEFFKLVGTFDQKVTIERAPWSWAPLLWYLNCDVQFYYQRFQECRLVGAAWYSVLIEGGITRAMLDSLCSFRPETADGLRLADVGQYPRRRYLYETEEFIATTNSSYYRPEVTEYLERLREFTTTRKRVVMVPCTADKPYPAPLHVDVLSLLPSNDYHLLVCTGVLGLVPLELWPIAPNYDAGCTPKNQWRIYLEAKNYFNRNRYERIIVYNEANSRPIFDALRQLWPDYKPDVTYVFPVMEYDQFSDLRDPRNLGRLKKEL